MMKRFRKYVEEKELILSSEKSKVMIFERVREYTGRRESRRGEENEIYYAKERRNGKTHS